MAHGIEHGLVFGLHRDEVAALVLVEMSGPLDGKIVAFRCARRPDDFTGIRSDKSRHMAASLFNSLLGLPAVTVTVTGGIAELLVKIRNHFVDHAGVAGRRRGIVEVYGQLHHESFLKRIVGAGDAWMFRGGSFLWREGTALRRAFAPE